ncbi:MAG: hypothetical protein KF782_02480 [Labilithrix sp.]|nr:hypothetical protein [Labilithrix sp.]
MRAAFARLALPVLLLATAGGCTVGAPAAGTAGAPPGASNGAEHAGDDAPSSWSPSADEPARGEARWTVFVYANGDNGRSADLEAELARMNDAPLGEDVHVVVLADWNAGLTDREGRRFPSGSDWITLPGGGAAPTVHREREQDFDDPAVLRAALARAYREHPAERHGLIVWSRGEAGDTQDGTRAGASAMSTSAMIAAVRAGLADAGISGALDVLGLDSYAPARVEVAYAARDVARVYVANRADHDGTSWAYPDAFAFLARTPSATGTDFAAFEAAAAGAQNARPHAAIRTDKLEGLASATASLVHAVAERPAVLPRVVDAIAVAASSAEAGWAPSYARFASELARTADDAAVTTAAELVVAALVDVSVQASGAVPEELGIGLPFDASPASAAEYLETARAWCARTGWDALLTSFLTGGSGDGSSTRP